MKVIINKFSIIKNLSELEDLLPQEAVDEICVSGDNDVAVEAWCKKIDFELNDYVIEQCQGYGAHDDFAALSSKEQREFALWCAAWNRSENEGGAE